MKYLTLDLKYNIAIFSCGQMLYLTDSVDVTFLCVGPVIDHEFRHKIVKVALYPRGRLL